MSKDNSDASNIGGKIFLGIFLSTIVIGVLLIFFIKYRGVGRLKQKVTELEKKGYFFSYEDYDKSFSPIRNNNPIKKYDEAARLLEKPILDDKVLFFNKNYDFYTEYHIGKDIRQDVIEQSSAYLAKNQKVIDLIYEGGKLKFQENSSLRLGRMYKDLLNLLKLKLTLELNDKKINLANETIINYIKLLSYSYKSRNIYFYNYPILEISQKIQLLMKENISEKNLNKIISILKESYIKRPLSLKLSTTRYYTEYEKYCNRKETYSTILFYYYDNNEDFSKTFNFYKDYFIYKYLFLEEDIIRGLNNFEENMDRIHIKNQINFKKFKQYISRKVRDKFENHLSAKHALWWTSDMKRLYISQANQDLLLTGLALEKYYIHNNKYPESLKDIVPKYLDKLYYDPYTNNKYFRYIKNTDKSYKLYSIGRNLVDDGGINKKDIVFAISEK